MLAPFTDRGVMPDGYHVCTWEEAEERFCGNTTRTAFFEKLKRLAKDAKSCGFLAAFVGGSFPTAKEGPSDIDVSWITEEGVTKDTVRPECIRIMEGSCEEWDMGYLPIGTDLSRWQYWAGMYGYDYKNNLSRGVIILELSCL